jgi:catechol-2,3-dioxygenase
MTDESAQTVRPQPMIAVADVEEASRWYQQVLGAASGHGGPEYEQLLVGGQLVLSAAPAGDWPPHHHRALHRSQPTVIFEDDR